MSDKVHLLNGRQIGRYTIDRQIGQGGMASVFLAQVKDQSNQSVRIEQPWNIKDHAQDTLSKSNKESWVALKILHPHLASDPKAVSRFWEEISVASQLKHQNICHVLDLGDYEGVPYLIMPFLRGQTLAQLIYGESRRQIPLAVALSIILDLAQGLAYAQQLTDSEGRPLDLIHRDVSPHNAFVEFNGHAKILDFGIAQIKKLHHSTLGNQLGKVAYMAPEQFENEVTQQSDMWALAVTAWELLTLHPLFDAEHHVKTMYQVLSAPIKKIRHYREDLSEELEQVLLSALNRDIEQRPPHIKQWRQAIEDAIAQDTNLADQMSHRQSLTAAWMQNHFAESFELPLEYDDIHGMSSKNTRGPIHLNQDTPTLSEAIYRSQIKPSFENLMAKDNKKETTTQKATTQDHTQGHTQDHVSTHAQSALHSHPSNPSKSGSHSSSTDGWSIYKKSRQKKFGIILISLALIGGVSWQLWQSKQSKKNHTHIRKKVVLHTPQKKHGMLSVFSHPCQALIYNQSTNSFLGQTPLNITLPAGIYTLSLQPKRKKKSCYKRSILVEIKEKASQVYEIDLTIENIPK